MSLENRGQHVNAAYESARVATAYDELREVLADACRAGLIVPCAGRAEWTSTDAQERAQAAAECPGCPGYDACHEAAQAGRERFGVWAGRDRGAR